MSDLSQYELQRLERIRQNRAMLAELGVASTSSVLGGSLAKKVNKKKRSAPAAAAIRVIKREASQPKQTRSSKRLKSIPAPVAEQSSESESDDEGPLVDYADIPMDTDQLDDSEFEIYAILRKWRLKRKNELQVEPYKIFQNRTLCDAVRRRRNVAHWASSTDQDERSKDLLECWGIGASKVDGCKLSDEGFAHELACELASTEVVAKLEESRANDKAKVPESHGDSIGAASEADETHTEGTEVKLELEPHNCDAVANVQREPVAKVEPEPVPKVEPEPVRIKADTSNTVPSKQATISTYFSRQ